MNGQPRCGMMNRIHEHQDVRTEHFVRLMTTPESTKAENGGLDGVVLDPFEVLP